MKVEIHNIRLTEVKMITWKIKIIMKFCFDIVRFKKVNENRLTFQANVHFDCHQ
jgi:hypothetical protein